MLKRESLYKKGKVLQKRERKGKDNKAPGITHTLFIYTRTREDVAHRGEDGFEYAIGDEAEQDGDEGYEYIEQEREQRVVGPWEEGIYDTGDVGHDDVVEGEDEKNGSS